MNKFHLITITYRDGEFEYTVTFISQFVDEQTLMQNLFEEGDDARGEVNDSGWWEYPNDYRWAKLNDHKEIDEKDLPILRKYL